MEMDRIDTIRAQWREALPDLDTSAAEVLGRIYRISHLVAPTIEAVMDSFGLDRGEFDVLASLRRAGAPFRLSPTFLYQNLLISSGSLTHRLGRLERAGMIERLPSPDDGRSLHVQLTEKGRTTVEQAYAADMAAEGALIRGLNDADAQTLAQLLRKATLIIERNLGAEVVPPSP